jgi:hypothetical protein
MKGGRLREGQVLQGGHAAVHLGPVRLEIHTGCAPTQDVKQSSSVESKEEVWVRDDNFGGTC